MEYLQIKSKGEIDTQAFSLLGNSTKTGDDSKIGMFGSGLKYAIAALLRNKVDFKVFSGDSPVIFDKKPTSFRDKEFDVITINGKDTSFTTSLGGKDWDSSFAPLREIYSNALDEDNDSTIMKASEAKPITGYTVFYIEMTESVRHFHENIALYFCTQNPEVLFSTEHGSVYRSFNGEVRLFRKGILCHHRLRAENEKEQTLFNYNSSRFEINESRVLSNEYTSKYYVGSIWRACENERHIKRLLTSISGGNSGRFEHYIHWDKLMYISSPLFSETWHDVVSQLKFVAVEHTEMFSENELKGRLQISKHMLDALQTEIDGMDVLGFESKDGGVFSTKEPSTHLTDKVLDALIILHKTNYSRRIEHELDIKYVQFSDKSILAQATKGQVLLSVALEDHTTEKIAKIIMEENEHNRTDFDDCTRSFQNHWISLYYEQLKLNGHERNN